MEVVVGLRLDRSKLARLEKPSLRIKGSAYTGFSIVRVRCPDADAYEPGFSRPGNSLEKPDGPEICLPSLPQMTVCLSSITGRTSCVTRRYGTMTIRSSKMIGFTTRTRMRLGFGCWTTNSCWSGPRLANWDAYGEEPAAFNG